MAGERGEGASTAHSGNDHFRKRSKLYTNFAGRRCKNRIICAVLTTSAIDKQDAMSSLASLVSGADRISVSGETRKTYAFDVLRKAIVTGVYKPGVRLNESQLSRELNISRIPIREALMQLHDQGLVINHPRRGMFVTEPTTR